MRIDNANISLQGQVTRERLASRTIRQSIEVTQGNAETANASQLIDPQSRSPSSGNETSLSLNGLNITRLVQQQSSNLQSIAHEAISTVRTEEDNQVLLLEKMGLVQNITQSVFSLESQIHQVIAIDRGDASSVPTGTFVIREIEFIDQSRMIERNQFEFMASGQVKTEDGRDIDFLLELNYRSEKDLSLLNQTSSTLIDPLVINLDGGPPELSDTLFEFDLNSDGETESIHQVAQGTGYLVFDHNQNNIIDDGSEMFGPASGHGFHELAAYDEDGNGWIDENDSVFSQLGILQYDAQGNQNLTSLLESGVGALYLGYQEGTFDLEDQQSVFQAQIQRSGVALSEQGQVLSLQELHYPAELNNNMANIQNTESAADQKSAGLNTDINTATDVFRFEVNHFSAANASIQSNMKENDGFNNRPFTLDHVQTQMQLLMRDESLFSTVEIGQTAHIDATQELIQDSPYHLNNTSDAFSALTPSDTTRLELKQVIDALKAIRASQEQETAKLALYRKIDLLD